VWRRVSCHRGRPGAARSPPSGRSTLWLVHSVAGSPRVSAYLGGQKSGRSVLVAPRSHLALGNGGRGDARGVERCIYQSLAPQLPEATAQKCQCGVLAGPGCGKAATFHKYRVGLRRWFPHSSSAKTASTSSSYTQIGHTWLAALAGVVVPPWSPKNRCRRVPDTASAWGGPRGTYRIPAPRRHLLMAPTVQRRCGRRTGSEDRPHRSWRERTPP
jgi:hypothetical protein